jgi:hypothetical protein
MGILLPILALFLSTCYVTCLDKMKIVATSGEHVLVKEGGVANISCTTDQEWFFCLWQHPSGVKECSIQENGTYQNACIGMDHTEIYGSEKFCSLKVENVRDHGTFMCLLNQADVFHTDRQFVKLEVATQAQLQFKKDKSDITSILELVEGEIVDVQYEGRRAYPAPQFQWEVSGIELVMSTEV